MWLVRPWYIFPSLPGSFSAFLSCSPMHVRYAVFSEKTLLPNSSCGNCVVMLGMLLGRPHMAF
jgi:hypothetical protein